MTKKPKKRKNNELFQKYHGSIHHIVPVSRGGPKHFDDWNTYEWKQKKHRAWHQLFYNFLPSEAINIISAWVNDKGEFNVAKMGSLNLKAWEAVFGNTNPQKAIKFIKEEFLPAEIKFLKEIA